MKKNKLFPLSLLTVFLLMLFFQVYWLTKMYADEKIYFQKQADIVFKETVFQYQQKRIEADSFFINQILQQPANNIKEIRITKPVRGVPIMPFFAPDDLEKFDTSDKPPKMSVKMVAGDSLPLTSAMLFELLAKKNAKMRFTAINFPADSAGIKKMLFFGKPPDSAAAIRFQSQSVVTELQTTAKNDSLKAANIQIKFKNNSDYTFTINSTNKKKKDSTSFQTPKGNFIKLISSSKAINDPIAFKTLDSIVKNAYQKAGISNQFAIEKMSNFSDSLLNAAKQTTIVATDFFVSGLKQPVAYRVYFPQVFPIILQRMLWPIVGSVILLLIIATALLYANKSYQQQAALTAIKNDFISNITHELKTPIATVCAAIEAMQKFNVLQQPEKTKEYLQISEGELQRLNLLVDKVLKLSMFENAEVTLQKVNFSLLALITDVIKSFELQFQKKHASVTFTNNSTNDVVLADYSHIASIIYNLLDNALKYGGDPPAIQINLHNDANFAIISITDNGLGIPAEYQNKIFDKFFRVPNNNIHNVKGYGLGLSYVSHIVALHNGKINLVSTPNKGSSFNIYLPL